ALALGDPEAGEGRRDRLVLDLSWVAGGNSNPGTTGGEQRREADDVVLDDDVGLDLLEDLQQPIVDVLGAFDQRLECRSDEALELMNRRFAEDRRRVADEVLPELAGN